MCEFIFEQSGHLPSKEEDMKSKQLAWINFIGLIVVIAMNYLVASGMIPMLSPQKEVSQLYQTSITPAGFTFSIWGVIYLLLFIAVIHMIKTADSTDGAALISATTPYLWGMYACNILWNIVFCAKLIELSVVMILGYWFCLFMICRIIKNAKQVHVIHPLAFGIHTGWLTIATIVNLYAMFVKLGWNWFGIGTEPEVFIAVFVAVISVILLQTKLQNPALPLSIAWAFFGIYSRLSTTYGFFTMTSIALNIGTVVLIGLSVATFIQNDQRFTPVK